eukprot:m.139307 g.139307  ORF g.139307 m.139307 type:complete len:57 (-) comp17617_c0_seq3:35-205(-)
MISAPIVAHLLVVMNPSEDAKKAEESMEAPIPPTPALSLGETLLCADYITSIERSG